jgi:O-acetyl-ADP-ribose deacetylase (regulator of RNase III)
LRRSHDFDVRLIFPIERAARIAVAEVRVFLADHLLPATVTFVCFGTDVRRACEPALVAPTAVQ